MVSGMTYSSEAGNYMKPYWENRLAESENIKEEAMQQLGRIALIEMDQLRIPLEQFMEHEND